MSPLARAVGWWLSTALIACTAEPKPTDADDAAASTAATDTAQPSDADRSEQLRALPAMNAMADDPREGSAAPANPDDKSANDRSAPDKPAASPGKAAADAKPAAAPPKPDAAEGVSGEILTQRYDNARTGANLDEHVLTRDNAQKLSLLGSWRVDAEIYAQVLVADAVELAGGRHAVAIVATLNNTLYAFDADAAPAEAFLWQQGLHGELGTPAYCARNIGGPNGILSTPVIDKARGHVYVVARDCDPQFPPEMPRCEQRLFQIALTSGEVLRSLSIQGEVLARDDQENMRSVRFEPSAHWNRPGLLLSGDDLVIAFGSGPAGNQHEEDFVYHGWAFRYRVNALDRAPDVYCTTPLGRGGSVWQSGAAPAADELGIYLTGANGIQADGRTHPPEQWPTAPHGQEDSVVRLAHTAWPVPQGGFLQYWDNRNYLSQGNVFQHMESGDNGFGSSGPMLIPGSRLLLVGSKAGLVYLLDRETMHAVQEPISPFTDLALQPGHSLYLHSWWGIPMITQAFVFWRPDVKGDGEKSRPADHGYAYAWAGNDRLRQFRFDYAEQRLQLTATADVPAVLGGGNLILSGAGGKVDSGVLWATSRAGTGTGGPEGVVWAFDPVTLELLWRTQTPAWSKFNPPTIVRGRVFVPSTTPGDTATQQVLVYGVR